MLLVNGAGAETAVETEEATNTEEAAEAEPAKIDLDVPLDALVIVTGDEGVGSGFLANIKGRHFIVTNIHVVGGNEIVSFATASGRTIEASPNIFVASKEDVAIIPITEPEEFLYVTDELDESVNIGDEIVVMGNSQGAAVVTRLEGKVEGVGPSTYEVSATFVPGNSGSPVLHANTGKVVGVAAYLIDNSDTKDRWTKGSEFQKIRRFAFRLDTISEWQRATLPALKQDSDAVAEYEAVLEGVAEFAKVLNKQRRFQYPEQSHAAIKSPLRTFFKVYDGRHSNGSDGNMRALRELNQDIQAEIRNAYTRAGEGLKYGYYKDHLNYLHSYSKGLQEYVESLLL